MNINIKLTPDLLDKLPPEVVKQILLDLMSQEDTNTPKEEKVSENALKVPISAISQTGNWTHEEGDLIAEPVVNQCKPFGIKAGLKIIPNEIIDSIGKRVKAGQTLSIILKEYPDFKYTSVYTRLLKAGYVKKKG
jgi:hypothetical protein